MPTLQFSCELDAPLERVWAYYNTIETLFKLTPPEKHARLEGPPEPMRQGVIYHIRVKQFGVIPVHMASEIVEYTPPNGFVDVQVPGKGPFKSWTHQHRFIALTDQRTRLVDHVHYEMPFGAFGAIANQLFVSRDLERMFAYRYAVTKQALQR